jgi:hypothetical protein
MTLRDAIKQSGAKAGSFTTMGDKISGVVIAAELRQARSFDTGKLETWDNGDPKENAVVTISTDLRDADDAHDDGTRAVYVKWWGDQRLAFIQTVKQATRNLPEDQQDVMPGGWFSAQWTGELPPTQKGLNGAKTFTYEYRPPAGGIGKAIAGSNVAPPAVQHQTTHPGAAPYREVPVQPPVQQPQLPIQENLTGPTTAPAAPSADPMAVISQIRQLASEGMPPQVIAQIVPQYSAAAIAAILGLAAS